MTNCVINNETIENCNPLPFLTITLPNKEVTVMTNSIISETPKVCQVEGCERRYYAKGFCKKHYRQDKYDGGIRRTVMDPNEFIVDGDICRILIYDKNAEYKHTCLIDTEDLALVKNHKWMSAKSTQGLWYVRTMIDRKIISIHSIIMAGLLSSGLEVDHKDHNTFDNRKQNLRVCTRSQNMMNKEITKNNTSGFKGVSFNKDTQRWMACLRKADKFIYLGLHNTATEAARIYNDAAVEYFGEFACLNRIGN